MELYTAPPEGSTVICADELGPVSPRTFPPAPGWSPGGHRVKAPLEYSRGPDKTWVGQKFCEERVNFVCPWHGYEYDIKTGECVSDRKLKLRKYKVVQKGDDVYVIA